MNKTILSSTLAALAALSLCAEARAQEASFSASADASAPPSAPEGEKNEGGAFVLGAKAGALASFNGLGPNVTGALELGYVFPWLSRGIALLVDVGYAAPVASGEESDPRVAGGRYSWHIVQKQLTLAPSLYYRHTGLGKLVPYAGIGPRIFFLESVTDSDGKQPLILETKEQGTKVGLGVHAGVDYLLGPGALLGELLFQWADLDHQQTGDTSLAGLTIWIGYRFML